MRLALPTVFALLLLLVAATAPAPVAAAQDDGLAPDGVTVHVDIEDDGDARWTVSTSYVLNDSSSRTAFEDVAARFERGQGNLGFSLRTFEQVVPRVAERTGRDMAIEGPEWTSGVVNESGVPRGELRLSFTWTNFANVRNESVTLSGVFAGGWFGDLGPDQTLVIEPPDGFDVSSAQPSHETVNGSLKWAGPVTFGPNEPVAQFERQPVAPDIPWASIAGAVLTALVIGGIIAYAWFWRSSRDTDQNGRSAEGETAEGMGDGEPATGTAGADSAPGTEQGGTDAESSAANGTDTAAGTAPGSGAAEGADVGDAAGVAAGAAGEQESEPEPEPELLSDEERVERLLEEQGGRMKQAKIVDETRWSNAKVSQLLSQMADEGRVEKLRIGRENLISLPEDEPSDGSP